MNRRTRVNLAALLITILQLGLPAPAALASFAGTDVVLPSVGRGSGQGGSQWYTTLWVHNPGDTAVDVQLSLYLRDQVNPAPDGVFNDSIPPGDTRRYTDAVSTLFGVTGFGALRVTAAQPVVVNGRIYSVNTDGAEAESVGQFFAAIPVSFALAAGQSTSVVGVHQTDPQGASDYRYNFGLMEVSGGAATVQVTALDGDGTQLGSRQYQLGAFQPMQKGVSDVVPGIDTDNARLEVEVLSGDGKVVAFGSGLANQGNDPSTFEMKFDDALLASSGSGDALTLPYSGSGTTSGALFTLENLGSGPSLQLTSDTGMPLRADTESGWAAVSGFSEATTGIYAQSGRGSGLDARSTSGHAIFAASGSTVAVVKAKATGAGASAVLGEAIEAASWGVTGAGPAGSGHLGGEEVAVYGLTAGSQVISIHGVATGTNSVGVYGLADSGALATGIYGKSSQGYAGYFNGKVHVYGDLNVTGTKNFRIDHPLDPEGSYLVHAAVESAEVLNLYSGTAILDASGRAAVKLPAWFDAVNRDLRYQLTCVGGFAPVYVAEEVRDRRFVIAGGTPGLKVSWQVTGVRCDPWLQLHPFQAEVGKRDGELGTYLCPECFGQPESRSLAPAPGLAVAE